jgi:hypothetical protein
MGNKRLRVAVSAVVIVRPRSPSSLEVRLMRVDSTVRAIEAQEVLGVMVMVRCESCLGLLAVVVRSRRMVGGLVGCNSLCNLPPRSGWG